MYVHDYHGKTTLPKLTYTAPYFSCEYPVFMHIRVVMIPSDLDGLKDGIFLEKYWVVQVYFGKVALLCTYVTINTAVYSSLGKVHY